MRKITLFSTKGVQKSEINTDVTSWGNLIPLIENLNYDLSSLHATENINRTNLEHIDAVLPSGDFTIFLRPKKTKSGLNVKGLGFKELRNIIKEQGQPCIDFLNKRTSKSNYTQMTTLELTEGLTAYKPKTATASKVVTKVPAKKVVTITKKEAPKKVVKTEIVKTSVKKNVTKVDSITRLKKEAQKLEKGFRNN